jgi:starch synthase
MKVALSVIGKFHTFDLARELHQRGMLAGIFTGYPRFKLKGEGLPQELVKTFPWLQTPYMAMPRKEWLGRRVVSQWEHLNRLTFDRHVASRLPVCDVFVGLSSSALHTGVQAQRRGARYVCDRGSTHIRIQDQLLREEHQRWGATYEGIDPRTIEREEAEYAAADLVTVPSTFNLRSFVSQGVDQAKLRVLPYGVNLSLFHPTAQPSAGGFDVIFVGGMGLRKGVPDLIKAFEQVQHSRKTLTFVGSWSPVFVEQLKRLGLWSERYVLKGHVPQAQLKDIMSRAHVMVLPSIEEGLALVQAQALACGCPVIATTNTGAEDLFEDGQQGYIVPIRQSDLLAQRMQHLADHPDVRDAMGQSALQRVKLAGGWHQYGEQAVNIYSSLLQG